MPVHKYKLAQPLEHCERNGHVIVDGPLSKRDLTRLHKYSDEQALSIWRIQADSLEFLADWADLRNLRLYGCKIGDYSQLTKLKRLKHLFVNGIRDRAPDLSFLSRLAPLVELGVGQVPHLIRFPDLSRCTRLKRLQIFGCKRLLDVSAVSRIRSLETFDICGTPQQPTDLEAIMAMPKMKFMSGGFGRAKPDALFQDLLNKHGLVYG